MRSLFVDTSGWYGAMVRDDPHHRELAAVLRAAVERRLPLVTSTAVVGECFTLLRFRRFPQQAFRFLELVETTPRVRVEHLSSADDLAARQLLRRFHEHDFSYVDATSFAVMRRLRLQDALTHDAHFAAAGFLRVPFDVPFP